jgi:hypothetical protein
MLAFSKRREITRYGVSILTVVGDGKMVQDVLVYYSLAIGHHRWSWCVSKTVQKFFSQWII